MNLPVWLTGLGASLAIDSYQTLRFLHVTIMVDEKENGCDPLCGLSCELRFITGNNILEELELFVVIDDDVSFKSESEDWSDFDSVLTESGAFPMLHRVSVQIAWCSDLIDVMNLLMESFKVDLMNFLNESLKKDKFPRLVERKAVEFNFRTK